MLHTPQNIRLARLLSDKTQVEFAEKLKVTPAMLKSYESGKAKPDELFISRLSKFSKVSETDLLNKKLTEEDFGVKVDKVEKEEVTKTGEPAADYGQPILQVVLNLSYAGKKNADSIDKMADSNLLNAKSLSTLINLLASNSDLAALLSPSQIAQHIPGNLPGEAFAPGTMDNLNQEGEQQSDKKKVKGK